MPNIFVLLLYLCEYQRTPLFRLVEMKFLKAPGNKLPFYSLLLFYNTSQQMGISSLTR